MARYSRLLWSVAGAILRDAPDQDVEECVADAFIYLWQHPERYDPKRGKLKAWLSAIAKSRALDRLRQRARRQELPLDESAPAGTGSMPEELADQDVEDILEGLGEEEKEVLRRRYCHGQKPGEIALDLGLPVKRVENRIYRGKQKLRQKIEKEATK